MAKAKKNRHIYFDHILQLEAKEYMQSLMG